MLNHMNENQLKAYYSLLKVTELDSDEDITRSFKKLAMQFHPDRNRGNIEWANKAMAEINAAYTAVMSDRFVKTSETAAEEKERRIREELEKERRREEQDETLIARFV